MYYFDLLRFAISGVGFYSTLPAFFSNNNFVRPYKSLIVYIFSAIEFFVDTFMSVINIGFVR